MNAPNGTTTAIVTGSSGGIGGAVVATLLAAGYRVAGIDRRAGDNASLNLVADLGDPRAVDDAVGAAVDALGHVDALVNVAGWTSGALLHETAPDDWHAVMDANLTSAYLCSRAVLPGMMSRRSGVIVMLSSINARQPAPGLPAYSAAKAALKALARQIAVDYGPHGIRALSVSPGWIRTADTESRLGGPDDEARLRETGVLPATGTPDDVAATIAFLISPGAAAITGVDVPIDAGATVVQTGTVLRNAFRRRMGRPDLTEAPPD